MSITYPPEMLPADDGANVTFEPTAQQIEDAARAIYFCMHSVMHAPANVWATADKAWLYRECATAALRAIRFE